jgi:hypothetical protein
LQVNFVLSLLIQLNYYLIAPFFYIASQFYIFYTFISLYRRICNHFSKHFVNLNYLFSITYLQIIKAYLLFINYSKLYPILLIIIIKLTIKYDYSNFDLPSLYLFFPSIPFPPNKEISFFITLCDGSILIDYYFRLCLRILLKSFNSNSSLIEHLLYN